MPPQPAAAVQLSDLGSYQSAVRLVLTHDVITATRPRTGTLDQVLRWADQLARDLRDVLGYTLIATTELIAIGFDLQSFTIVVIVTALFQSADHVPCFCDRLVAIPLEMQAGRSQNIEIRDRQDQVVTNLLW